jgi:endonuclease/exonuclease/phosphatase (EEP) superfamily protein YafD
VALVKRPVFVKWLRRLVVASAIAYPVALLAIWLLLRYVGEAWWATTAALYLPRYLFGLPLPVVAIAAWALEMRRLAAVQLASLAVLLFPVMRLVVPWPVSADASAPTVRVVSMNVNAGRAGADVIADAVMRYSPDVVLFQETAGNETLVAPLRAHFPTVATSTQFLIATRFPVLKTNEPPKVSHDGTMRSARFIEYVLDTPLGEVSFFSVHPISPREGLTSLRGDGLRREIESGRLIEGTKAGSLEANTRLRAIQVEALSQAAAQEAGPVVIAGDTNLPDASPLLRRNLGAYDDAFLQVGSGFGYTFPTNKRFPAWMRIDRIVGGRGVRFTHFEIGRPVVSDHHFIVADLQKR